MQQLMKVVQTVCIFIISSDFMYIYTEFYISALVSCIFEDLALHLKVELGDMGACWKWHMYVACGM